MFVYLLIFLESFLLSERMLTEQKILLYRRRGGSIRNGLFCEIMESGFVYDGMLPGTSVRIACRGRTKAVRVFVAVLDSDRGRQIVDRYEKNLKQKGPECFQTDFCKKRNKNERYGAIFRGWQDL